MGSVSHEVGEIGWGLLVRAITYPIEEIAFGREQPQGIFKQGESPDHMSVLGEHLCRSTDDGLKGRMLESGQLGSYCKIQSGKS